MALRRLRESGNLPHAVLIIWSDAMRNAEGRSQSVNYRWNQMEITIEVDGRAAERPSSAIYLESAQAQTRSNTSDMTRT